ncbi:glycosyltransferase family 2 protein [Pseudooceanicola sp. HF7]|uniref:glycosyltransferase n=1 Tax=Pseudooceanicola sp. HF7 TaxID=2721560 RepID=UPI00142FF564|nr:glycosyltransferase family 2 protein [Pseudooceanicola sp. HF7]
MSRPPLAARSRAFGPDSPWPAAITIPARNEAERILFCLEAARLSLRDRGGIVLVVNGSTDATFARAKDWFTTTRTAGLLMDLADTPPGGVGAVRRQAVAAATPRLAPQGVVLTTDADSRVCPDWLDANLSELSQADLICGTVLPDAQEFAQLPRIISQRGAAEGEYVALTLALRALIDPLEHDLAPCGLGAAGASLAFRMPLYLDTGGIPALPRNEDRAFAAIAEDRGWRVRHSEKVRVSTSCRLDGRAPGGMAEALAQRISDPDPLVDSALEPADRTLQRSHLRRARREDLARFGPGSLQVAQIDRQLAGLARIPMRLSDVERELPLLAAAVCASRAAKERLTA